jgi:phosphate/sulfate permease
MNLDNLKTHINKKLEGSQSFEMAIDSAIYLHKTETNSIAHKIKRSLITEIIFSIIFIGAFIYVITYTKYESIRIYFSVFTIIIVLFTFLLFYLLKRTITLTAVALPIIENLKRLHSILSEFVKRYFQFTMFLIPICLLFSLCLGYTDKQDNINSLWGIISLSIEPKIQLILFSIFIVILSGSMYFFTKWYIKKLYGTHLQELKK